MNQNKINMLSKSLVKFPNRLFNSLSIKSMHFQLFLWLSTARYSPNTQMFNLVQMSNSLSTNSIIQSTFRIMFLSDKYFSFNKINVKKKILNVKGFY